VSATRQRKWLGVVGGLGPESTVDYYNLLIARYRARTGDDHYPAFIVNSLNLKPAVDAVTAGDLATLTRIVAEGVEALARAGADFGLIAANTPHIVFDEVRKRARIPLISIVEAARDAAQAAGHRRLVLFGTRFTMRGRFYPDVFEPAGIAIVPPPPADQDWIHEKYFGELLLGIVKEETRAGLLAIIERLRDAEGIDGLLIAGTELSLILRMDSHAGVPFLDTAKIHVERALDEMLGR
jgi:aspartate racemase